MNFFTINILAILTQFYDLYYDDSTTDQSTSYCQDFQALQL